MSHKKINILYVIDTLFIGGAEQHVATLCKHIDKEKFHVVVCTLFSRVLSQAEPFAIEIGKMGIRVERLGLTTWRDIKTFKKYSNLIDEENIDIVHAHTVPADFWGCLIAKILKHRKTIVTLHAPDPQKTLVSGIQYILVNTWLSDKIIEVSNHLKHVAIKEYCAKADKIMVIPNQVDVTKFHHKKTGTNLRAEYHISNDMILIGSVGRFIKRKGFEICLQVFAEVQKQHSRSKFILCGYGEEEDFYRTLIRDLGIEENVILTGHRMDVDEVMAAIDIFIFTPYYGEGFGLVLIEAMASGKPVVASNVFPTPEIVLNNVTGFLPFPEKAVAIMERVEIDPFVEKIRYLIEHKDVRGKMGMEGRRIVEERYGTKVVMKQIETLYERVSCRS
ncbi:MAG TPA: glycosyltransferase [Candidatus Wunengus sp. YC60]|uniref:glycosyltransferase n=1 Tax=Candidatus Wunengus sp. YC60 TaxID=3367697 RepID=UPI004029A07D